MVAAIRAVRHDSPRNPVCERSSVPEPYIHILGPPLQLRPRIQTYPFRGPRQVTNPEKLNLLELIVNIQIRLKDVSKRLAVSSISSRSISRFISDREAQLKDEVDICVSQTQEALDAIK